MVDISEMKARWIDGERESQCAPDPNHPHGIDIVGPADGPTCKTALPYPANPTPAMVSAGVAALQILDDDLFWGISDATLERLAVGVWNAMTEASLSEPER